MNICPRLVRTLFGPQAQTRESQLNTYGKAMEDPSPTETSILQYLQQKPLDASQLMHTLESGLTTIVERIVTFCARKCQRMQHVKEK